MGFRVFFATSAAALFEKWLVALLPCGATAVPACALLVRRSPRRCVLRPVSTASLGALLLVRTSLELVATRREPLAAIQSDDPQAVKATWAMRVPAGVITRARDDKLTVNTTSFRISAPGSDVVLLSEPFLQDDFRATLNDRYVPYFRVNHAFKAVAIPSAGDRNVTFEYRLHHWDLALTIAAGGVVWLVGLALPVRVSRGVFATNLRPQKR
jgi:hypothetical protein